MQDSDTSMPPASRPAHITGVVLLGVIALGWLAQLVWIALGEPRPGWVSDSLDYLLLADFYRSALTGDVPVALADYYADSRFPPLFPISLALFGAGAGTWGTAYFVTLACASLALGVSVWWFRMQTCSLLWAGILLLLSVATPGFFILNLEVLSEGQFVALLVLGLIAFQLWRMEQGSLLLVAALVGLLPLVRTAGIAMVVALLAWLAWWGRELPMRRRAVAMLIAVVPVLMWTLYRQALGISSSYTSKLAENYADGLGAVALGVLQAVPAMLARYADWFAVDAGPVGILLVVLLLCVAVLGWWQRLVAAELDAVFLPLYIGLIALWPYPSEYTRLLAVAAPVVAISAWSGGAYLCRRSGLGVQGMKVTLSGLALALVLSAPAWAEVIRRGTLVDEPDLATASRTPVYFQVPRGEELFFAEVITRYRYLVQALPTRVSREDCVWTSYAALAAHYANFGARFVTTPAGIDSVDSGRRQLAACRYVLTVDLTSRRQRASRSYPAEFIPYGEAVLVSEMERDGRPHVAAALLDLGSGARLQP